MQSPLSSVHRWVWRNARRRAKNLLRFAEVEADGGRDLVRAAEQTQDPLLRRLFLLHALDEQRHADLFRKRGLALMSTLPAAPEAASRTDWLTPGERGLDDLRVEQERDGALLAFLHLSEKAAARDFTHYIAALEGDPPTREVFEKVVHDEAFHMNYTRAQLLRVAPKDHGRLLWMARLRRLWSLYLRFAGALAAVIGAVVLTLQYFILLPPFALLARRAWAREPEGWTPIAPERNGQGGPSPLKRQY
ncbi:ferritin-like domain-containing protein [Caulobacter sp. UNC279MFTsu5.1]|uniref:ferritin-like domain-containing protein n=1 Tax=Caulobacter sp. UNC279MFTsu5.1 TaxID=1502775 RepID=UPI0008E791C3|nr:ferritin-like domain-containing protein [Caulobacter sp. UNC279MFTsu5.1]SFK33644.1 Rubrerythrin [Caulobacter sp. UNC279MFTsu5.1]